MTLATEHWVLTLACEDRPGIVHAISGAIVAANGNITESHQYTSLDTGRFFMRLQIESAISRDAFEEAIKPIAAKYAMQWTLDTVGRKMKTLVLVSKAAHCINDMLFRQRSGQLPIEIETVFGNHAELAPLAEFYGLAFENHNIKSAGIELIVLARFMQVLSPEFCDEFAGKIINIHHSFLPGFKGANPYAQAHARGVKLIGATAHFVTSDLDEGPIIEQNVVRVEHSASKDRLVSIGQDVESKTLTQAVLWFAEHRILLDGERTVIFS